MPQDPNIVLNINLDAPPIARAGFGTPLMVKDDLFPSGNPRIRTYSSLAEVTTDSALFSAEELAALTSAFAQSPRAPQIKVGARDSGDADLVATLTAIADADGDWYRFTAIVEDDVSASDAADLVAEAAAFGQATGRIAYISLPNAVAFDGSDELETQIEALAGLGLEKCFLAVHPEEGYATALIMRQSAIDLDARSAGPFNRVLSGFGNSGLTADQINELDDANIAYVQEVARNVNALRGAVTLAGRFPYVVETLDWFSARVREDYTQLLLDYASRDTKLPLTNEGINIVAQVVRGRLQQGEAADHFAPGGTRVTFPDEADVTPSDRASGTIRGEFGAQILVGTERINVSGFLTTQPLPEG